ncbi:MAG: hypothetical protein P4L84_19445 [Isosphaeraceae bacterium]|nr:hypothetical protein [Isosphaeraceae bacterium]
MPAGSSESQDDPGAKGMRGNERNKARAVCIQFVLAILAAQAITPDSHDLSSMALLRHLAPLRSRGDLIASDGQVPPLRHPTPPRPHSGDPWEDDCREETPDELCLPTVARTGFPSPWSRAAIAVPGQPDRFGERIGGGIDRKHCLSAQADVFGAGSSIHALCRLTC